MLLRFDTATRGAGRHRLLDVRPDDADALDYIFSPSLTLLPEIVDPRRRRRPAILDQGREGACVGFALAAVINTSIGLRRPAGASRRAAAPLPASQRVSERMLYEMARRYDEWSGERYEGSSLRGGMKGWHKHGVCASRLWPFRPGLPGSLDERRREDARRRPLGAYYRIVDSDASHLQAAIVEGDAVLASSWIHRGWRADRLERPAKGDRLAIRRIPFEPRAAGLHAFALIGYGPEGFIVQNSWGRRWGTGGLAILTYEDWMANRQDAWVARPGPETWDSEGAPKIFTVNFMGKKTARVEVKAGTEGLDALQEAFGFFINTGDRGEPSRTGRIRTPAESLPERARRVHGARPVNGVRHVVLYAHGGLNSEEGAAAKAGRLWKVSRKAGLTSYFFIWETGWDETLLGWIRSRDDAEGPRPEEALPARGVLSDAFRRLQKSLGKLLSGIVREGWEEMNGRAAGAATQRGGARLFAGHLFEAMNAAGGSEPFRLHLVAHSAGAIYLAELYDGFLRERLAPEAAAGRVSLGSVHFFAPALSIRRTKQIFLRDGALPVEPSRFRVTSLSDSDEDADSIGIYPSSLLTYVADCLEIKDRRVPVLGLREDLKKARAKLGNPEIVRAADSEKHGEFDDEGHEVERTLEAIARGEF